MKTERALIGLLATAAVLTLTLFLPATGSAATTESAAQARTGKAEPGCFRYGFLLRKRDCTARDLYRKVKALRHASDPNGIKLDSFAIGWVTSISTNDIALSAAESSIRQLNDNPAESAYRCRRQALMSSIAETASNREVTRASKHVVSIALRLGSAGRSVPGYKDVQGSLSTGIFAVIRDIAATVAVRKVGMDWDECYLET